eukprot:c26457_g1_i1 orf=653-1621(-)
MRETSADREVELQRQQTDSEYLKLHHLEDTEVEEFDDFPSDVTVYSSRWQHWAKLVLLGLLVGTLGGIFAVLGLPVLLDKVVIPLMEWESSTFSRPVLAFVLVGSMAVLPVLMMPSGPSMWLAGMIFGYGLGFLIIIVGTFIGMSIPFLIGRWLLHARIQRWLKRWPKRAAMISIADRGGWFYQFRVVFLLRISPIPYALFNYAVSTTNIKYGQYITASCAAMVPEGFISIYSGRLLRTLADMKHAKHHWTAVEIVYNLVGLCVAVGVTIAGTIYGRKTFHNLELKEAQRTDAGEQMDGPHTHQMDSRSLKDMGLVSVDIPF